MLTLNFPLGYNSTGCERQNLGPDTFDATASAGALPPPNQPHQAFTP